MNSQSASAPPWPRHCCCFAARRRPGALLRAIVLALAAGTGVFMPALRAQNAAPQPTVIESAGPGEMVSTDEETTITFRDRVVVTGTNLRLTCDYLQVVVARKGDASATLGKVDKFRSLLATGNVRIVQGDREAACGRAEVKPDEDKIVLSENPVVAFHGDDARLAGKRITMFRGDRRVVVEEPVSTLPPIRDLGFDPQKKSANPAPDAPKQP